MAKYIDADKLKEALSCFNDKIHGDIHFINGIETALELIDMQPVIEAEPIKHGRWRSELVKKEDWKGSMQSYYQPISCSLCHAAHYEESRCCPNCGARMDGE